MAYDYQIEKKELFKEANIPIFFGIREQCKKLLKESGAFTAEKAMSGQHGSSWTMLAVLDYLVEKGEIKRVTEVGKTAGQYQVFTHG